MSVTAGRLAAGASARVRGEGRRLRVAPWWRPLWSGFSFTLVALLTAVGMLVGLDWLLFDTPLVAPRLPLVDESSPYGKLLLADRYRGAEVLYLGDSRVFYGINPEIVSKTCQCGSGFNAGHAGNDPRLTRIMVSRMLQKLSPEIVVIGVSQWELSDAADIHVYGPAPELVPIWRWGEFGLGLDRPKEFRDALGDAWRTYKFRAGLRVALDPWAEDAGKTDKRRGFDTYQARRRVRESDLNERQAQWFTNYAVGGQRVEALRGVLADLRSRGIKVMLVAPPLYPNFHARVRRQVDAYRAAMSDLARQNGAVFEDLTDPKRSGLTAEQFLDVVHLNEGGTEKLSRQIAKLIRSNFGG